MHLVPKQHDGYSSNAHLREYNYMHAYLHAGSIQPAFCYLKITHTQLPHNERHAAASLT